MAQASETAAADGLARGTLRSEPTNVAMLMEVAQAAEELGFASVSAHVYSDDEEERGIQRVAVDWVSMVRPAPRSPQGVRSDGARRGRRAGGLGSGLGPAPALNADELLALARGAEPRTTDGSSDDAPKASVYTKYAQPDAPVDKALFVRILQLMDPTVIVRAGAPQKPLAVGSSPAPRRRSQWVVRSLPRAGPAAASGGLPARSAAPPAGPLASSRDNLVGAAALRRAGSVRRRVPFASMVSESSLDVQMVHIPPEPCYNPSESPITSEITPGTPARPLTCPIALLSLISTRPAPQSFASSFLRAGSVFSGSQGICGSRRPERCEDMWHVHVTVESCDWRTGCVSGTMQAIDVPDVPTPFAAAAAGMGLSLRTAAAVGQSARTAGAGAAPTAPGGSRRVTTYWDGEIVDFCNFELWTRKWSARSDDDKAHWRQFEPVRVIRKVLKDKKRSVAERALFLAQFVPTVRRDYVLMRWKERFFLNASSAHSSGLTIAGFYYVCMRRSDGACEGFYYDRHSSPYQRLLLHPAPSAGSVTCAPSVAGEVSRSASPSPVFGFPSYAFC